MPTLSEALNQMFIAAGASEEKSDILIKDILSKCHSKMDKQFEKIKEKYSKISIDDAYIICSYTCESKEKIFNPYRLLNSSLVSENRENGINNISKYLYILLNSLRKLEIYIPSKNNKYLYRSINRIVGLTADPFNEKYVPYIVGNTKTFWGFISTSFNAKTTYNFLRREEKIKKGTIFVLGGDIWGYDISLFNYFGEKEILLEPERKFVVDNVLPPLNEITHIHCKLLKTPLVLDNNNLTEKFYSQIQEDKSNIQEEKNKEKNENISINNEFKTNCICKISMEANVNGESKFISGMGVLCNITSKEMKALVTYNHIINLDMLNNEEKLVYINSNNEEIEIDMKNNRYKYTNEELDLTVIEIFEDEENENYFIEIDKFINSRDFEEEEAYLIEYNKKKIRCLDDTIKEKKNNYFICGANNSCEGIIILKENTKLIGIIKKMKKIGRKYIFLLVYY